MRPIIYYVNGKYWGIYYLRDKVNRYFVGYSSESHRDSIDLIEHQERVKVGDIKHYNRMLKYISKKNHSQQRNFLLLLILFCFLFKIKKFRPMKISINGTAILLVKIKSNPLNRLGIA